MYPGPHALKHPDRPAFIMAFTGETVSYREYEARCNRLAHLLRALGLRRGDHYALFMENNARIIESCAAGVRSGLYYTAANSYLTASELAYILENSESQVLITSASRLSVAREAMAQVPRIRLCLVVDAPADLVNDGSLDQADPGERIPVRDFVKATLKFPDTPIADESMGGPMLYSSGTTGRPKGVFKPLPDIPPGEITPGIRFSDGLWGFRDDMVYLSPAPLYHSAPNSSVSLTIRRGGTVIVMEKFDPERYLALVQQYKVTHSQLVPTMFSRMLKLPQTTRSRYDLSSLEVIIHAAAPCPVPVKEQMIAWWGPIIREYYGATEGLGFAACNSEQWLAHKGTVGKVVWGTLHVLDEALQPCPPGVSGTLWFEPPTEFEYFNDSARTQESRSPDGKLATVGDVGYLNEAGFLFLTDRATFMIISGGVNIYPQECENLLITHPKVADAAVFGIPNEDLGEEVKAVIQVMPGVDRDEAVTEELIAFCRAHLAAIKCPRSIDFIDEMPRLPTGKLYKKPLREKYWAGHSSRIV
ncbi:MAG: AMP-binding protein [Burkholderiales bacterium]|jgi:long-chain acyl-CoA synthetase